MSILSKCSLGFATALSAVVAFTVPATATDNGFQHSNNCVETDVPIDFLETDIGLLVDLVFERCGSTLMHGNYRRVSNQPNPDGAISAGNARLDAVVYDSEFRNPPQKPDCDIGGQAVGGAIKVVPKCIKAQIGVDFIPKITLSANIDVTTDTSAITITDTTDDDVIATTTFLPGQLVDAGSGVGGFDCVILIKKGVPKVADIICDMNMWYDDGGIVYGLKDYDFGQPVNRFLLMWMMGPNPTGSMFVTDLFCDAVNACDETGCAIPERNFGDEEEEVEGDLSLTEDPSDYANNHLEREETSISASASYLRVYGEPAAPFNLLSCFGTVAYCDVTEPSPGDGEVSGNACNRNFGSTGKLEYSFNQTLPGNPGSTSTQGGGVSYFDICNPFAGPCP